MGLKQGRERCGSVLVLVLVVMATLFTVGGALTMLALTETAIAHNQEQELKLYYITEAGIEAGMAALNNCFEYSEEITGELGGGCYRVVIRQGPVMRGDQHYDFLGDVSFDSVTQRLVIATGSLGGLQMAMAVIAESTPLAGKALAVSNRLALEESTIKRQRPLRRNPSDQGRKLYLQRAAMYCAGRNYMGGPGEAAVTVIAVADSGSPGEPVTITTYSEGNPLPGVLRAKAPVLPPLVPDDFLSGAAVIYTSSERWGRLPAQCDHVDSIVVRGDLVIEPGRGDRFAISEKVVIVEGDLEIAVEGAAVIANCIFVVGGSVTVTGSVSADSAAGKSRVMILSGRDIDLTGAKTDLEGGDQLFGSALLLYSKGEVVVGNRGFNGELKVKGAIIARELLLQRCTLDYCPEIYAEYCKTMSLGVVIKEWIRPWKL
jgi:hypothetical protein